MKVSAFLIALGLATPALADGLVPITQIGHVYTASADEPIPLAEQLRRNTVHERQTYDLIIANGGCNSDFNTVEYATFCGAVPFGFPQMGSKD